MKNTTNESQRPKQKRARAGILQTVLEKMGCGGCEVNLSETEEALRLEIKGEDANARNRQARRGAGRAAISLQPDSQRQTRRL